MRARARTHTHTHTHIHNPNNPHPESFIYQATFRKKRKIASRKYTIVNTRKYRLIHRLTYKLQENAADLTDKVRESPEKQVKRRNMPLFQLIPCIRREKKA